MCLNYYTHFHKVFVGSLKSRTVMAKCVIDLLLKYKDENRFPQEVMADRLGISQPTFSCWISGKNKKGVPLEHYPAIARLLGLPLKEIWPMDMEA